MDLEERTEAPRQVALEIVAHELRNAVSPILGLAETLSDRWRNLTDDERTLVITRIAGSAHALNATLERMIHPPSNGNGGMSVKPRAFDLVAATRSVTAEFAAAADMHRCNVLARASLPHARGDEVANRQVLLNLLRNAGRFAPPDSSLSVTVDRLNSHLRVSVVDHGSGLGPDVDLLFDARHSGDGAGAGLGLFISRQLVEAQGGRIWAENGKDGGACFRYTLPVDAG